MSLLNMLEYIHIKKSLIGQFQMRYHWQGKKGYLLERIIQCTACTFCCQNKFFKLGIQLLHTQVGK